MINLRLLIPLILIIQTVVAQNEMSPDGTWEIILDEKNTGRDDQWMMVEKFDQHPSRQEIQVPAAWERYKQDYEGVAFYKRSFQVPAHWENKVVNLEFGAVNYLSEVWLILPPLSVKILVE